MPRLIQYRSVDCPTPAVCYAVGNDSLLAAAFFKSEDSGNSWWSVHFDSDKPLYCVKFLNKDTGYVAGNGFFARTEDGGATWERPPAATLSFDAITIVNKRVLYAVGYRDSVGKSLDGGRTWRFYPTGSGGYLSSIVFPDSMTGYAVGNFRIVKTTDGGETWAPTDTVKWRDAKGVAFPSRDTGFIVGGSGQILRTINGAKSWDSTKFTTPEPLSAVVFVDTKLGYAVGGRSDIWVTEDGGEYWFQYLNEGAADFTAICINDPESGIAVGVFGVIVKLVGVQTQNVIFPPAFKGIPHELSEARWDILGRPAGSFPGSKFWVVRPSRGIK